MVAALKWKPKKRQTRIIYTDDPGGVMPEHKGKIFCVIGPFDDHCDKGTLQNMLTTILRGYNLEET
jgi:hypothetical protein